MGGPHGASGESGDSDGLETALQMAGISRGLFGEASKPTKLGRFVVLDRIGAGGMGTVFRAYDPDLDRSVALKVIRSEALTRDPKAQERMAKEARILAKLSHPNVVSVHEVGVTDGQLFVAMEMVDGGDLAQWLAQHPGSPDSPDAANRFERTLDYLLQAGRGLAAAHDAGVVHRDFKPANVLLGSDGRVRVADFGLARTEAVAEHLASQDSQGVLATMESEEASRTGGISGTPAYMAPEQRDGRTPDGLADQYAYCVSAWEALFGVRPSVADPADLRMPARMTAHQRSVARALRRGLCRERTQRFGSMGPLLDALARNPGRRRRRALFGAGTVVLLAGSGAAYGMERASRCDEAAAAAGEVWDAETRQRVQDGFAAVDFGGTADAWERFSVSVDDYVSEWTGYAEQTCQAAQVDGTLDPQTYAARTACLDDRMARLSGVLDVYETPDRDLLLSPPLLDDAVAPLRSCVERPGPVAEGSRELMRELARGMGVLDTGRQADAAPLLEAVADQAQAKKQGMLEARARFSLGLAMAHTQGHEASAAMLERAYWLALEHGDDLVAAHAARELSGTLIAARELDEGERWLKPAVVLVHRTDPGPAVWAGLERAKGRLAHARGDLEAAQSHYEREMELLRAELGPQHPNVLGAQQLVIVVLQQRGLMKQAQELGEEQLKLRAEVFGPRHSRTASGHALLGHLYGSGGQPEKSAEHLEAAIDIQSEVFGPDHWRVGNNLANLGLTVRQFGDERAALEHFRRAYAILVADREPDDGPALFAVESLGSSLLFNGLCEEGAPLLTGLVAALSKASEPAAQLGSVQWMLGSCLVQLGRYDEALAPLAAARVGTKDKPTKPTEAGAALIALARAKRGQGELDAAERLLEESRDVLATEGADPSTRVEGLAWLGRVQAESGDAAGAVATMQTALDLMRAHVTAPHERIAALGALARTAAVAGDLEQARTLAQQARDLLRSSNLKGKLSPMIEAELPLVLALAHRDADPSAAKSFADEALALLAKTDASGVPARAQASEIAGESIGR